MTFLRNSANKSVPMNWERRIADMQHRLKTYQNLLGNVESSLKSEPNPALYEAINKVDDMKTWFRVLKEAKVFADDCQGRENQESQEAKQIYTDAQTSCCHHLGEELGAELNRLAGLETSRDGYKKEITHLQQELDQAKHRFKLIEEVRMLRASLIGLASDLLERNRLELKKILEEKAPGLKIKKAVAKQGSAP